MAGIYRIVCTATGDSYVGKSVDPPDRVRAHFLAMAAGSKHSGIMLRDLYAEHGAGSFECEILELCDPSELELREWFWISLLRPTINHLVPDATATVASGQLAWKRTVASAAVRSASMKRAWARSDTGLRRRRKGGSRPA